MNLRTGKRPPADDEVLSIPEIRNMCVESEIEAFRPGIEGLCWDAFVITHPWRFRLEKILVPVQLWHGSADRTTTPWMAEFMAGRIPNCHLTICPDEGHLLLIPHWEEALSSLITK